MRIANLFGKVCKGKLDGGHSRIFGYDVSFMDSLTLGVMWHGNALLVLLVGPGLGIHWLLGHCGRVPVMMSCLHLWRHTAVSCWLRCVSVDVCEFEGDVIEVEVLVRVCRLPVLKRRKFHIDMLHNHGQWSHEQYSMHNSTYVLIMDMPRDWHRFVDHLTSFSVARR